MLTVRYGSRDEGGSHAGCTRGALRPLEPGEIITIEPGIYIPEEKAGLSIEDMIRIAPDGAELLIARLPRVADEMKMMLMRK